MGGSLPAHITYGEGDEEAWVTVTIGALLLALLVLALLAGSASAEPHRVTADDEPRRSPDDFEIHVTDYRGDLEDRTSTPATPWRTAAALVAGALAAVAVVVLASDL